MAITPSEYSLLEKLHAKLTKRRAADRSNQQFVKLSKRIEQLGMAVPQEMRRFVVPLGWPRVVLETITSRMEVRAMRLPGEDRADETLQTISDANNLSLQLPLWRQDYLTYGRGYISVNKPDESATPRMRAENPRFIEAEIDPTDQRMVGAARFYHDEQLGLAGPRRATLYMPGYTKMLAVERGRWAEVDRVNHGGPIPLILHLNRQWTGEFEGQSELSEINELTVASIRSITNMQFGQEAHGVPGIWATGVKSGDFMGADGKPLSQFEAYYDVVKMLTDPNARWGQFSAADLKNFETALNIYGTQAALAYSFPARYFGISSVNPPSEGAIIADEIQLVRSIEKRNAAEAVTLGWAAAEAYRLATGKAIDGDLIKVDYFDPSTPTVAQREDALAKRRGAGVLSREGYWDELGWSEARKEREREYLRAERAEALDPELLALADRLRDADTL